MVPEFESRRLRMKVYVVVSDYGMNTSEIHGAYTTRPSPEMIKEFVEARNLRGYTGYTGTDVVEVELDDPLQEGLSWGSPMV